MLPPVCECTGRTCTGWFKDIHKAGGRFNGLKDVVSTSEHMGPLLDEHQQTHGPFQPLLLLLHANRPGGIDTSTY